MEFDFIRRDGHIAQCAGSSGYRPHASRTAICSADFRR